MKAPVPIAVSLILGLVAGCGSHKNAPALSGSQPTSPPATRPATAAASAKTIKIGMLRDDASVILRDIGAKNVTIAGPKVQALEKVAVTESQPHEFDSPGFFMGSQAYLLADGTCVWLSHEWRLVMVGRHMCLHNAETRLTGIVVGERGKGTQGWGRQAWEHAKTIKVSKAGLIAVEVAPPEKKGN